MGGNARQRMEEQVAFEFEVLNFRQVAAARDDESHAIECGEVVIQILASLGSRVKILEGSKAPAAAQRFFLDRV